MSLAGMIEVREGKIQDFTYLVGLMFLSDIQRPSATNEIYYRRVGEEI